METNVLPTLAEPAQENATQTSSQWSAEKELLSRTGTSEDVRSLDATQRHGLRERTRQVRQHQERVATHAEHGAHGHGEKAPSILTAIAAAVINYLLMFGLCCAYGMIMFADDFHAQHRTLGVKMNLGTSFVMGLIVALGSKIAVGIGGPDLNPVVFIGGFVSTIGMKIAASLDLDYPDASGRRLDGEFGPGRLLGGSAGSTKVDFCIGSHLVEHPIECEEYQAQLRATVIFTTFFSSALLGLLFFLIGRFRLTKYVSYIPTSIQEAFLSCIGYKVFKYALKFSNYQPVQFVPAACVGVPLYFMKAYHVGNPALVMPLGLLVPLGFFYAYIYAQGIDVETARNFEYPYDLYFPEMDDVDFWTIWTDSLGKYDKINFKAWSATLPDAAIMVIVILLDCMLKISSTENKLPVKTDKDYEIMLYGAGNSLVAASGSSVGYMQLKFNVINYGVMGNVRDRRAGIIYAILCGICFFGTIRHFNYLPRFFLSALLFFAGAGFVAENLWGSRKYLSITEWLEILLILAVFIISGELLPAVVVGMLLTAISFVVKYAKVPAIAGKPLRGSEVATPLRKSDLAMQRLQHALGTWLLVIKLKGFVFFGSVKGVTKMVAGRMEQEEADNVPAYRRLKYVIFDCAQLDGMDVSAAKAVKKLVLEAKAMGVRIIFSSVTPEFAAEMKTREIISSDKEWSAELAFAVHYIQKQAQLYVEKVNARWLTIHPAFQLHDDLVRTQMTFEPFCAILPSDASRFGCPWRYCSRLKIKKHSTLLWEPFERHEKFYMVHSGAVGIYSKVPSATNEESWESPLAVYQQGSFLNLETLARRRNRSAAVALKDGELVCWTEEQWYRMSRERPLMAKAILQAGMRQSMQDGEAAAVTPPSDFTPRELRNMMEQLQTSLGLAANGFFVAPEPNESVTHPPMPEPLRQDLVVAFRTYCDSSDERISAENVSKALMFAGVFGTQLALGGKTSFSEVEFLVMGWEATMARLSPKQVKTLEELFERFDEDKSGFLQLDEQRTAIMDMTSNKNIDRDEVDGIAAGWAHTCQMDTSGSPLVDRTTYMGIMSRFIKKHESAWCVLKGLLEVTNAGELIKDGMATISSSKGLELRNVRLQQARLAECLKQLHRSSAENPEAMDEKTALERAGEMLWVANWRTNSKSDTMDLAGLLAAVTPLGQHDFEMQALPQKPPPEALKLEHQRKASKDHAEASAAVAGIVLDLREARSMESVLVAAAEKSAQRLADLEHHSEQKMHRMRTEDSESLQLGNGTTVEDESSLKLKIYRFMEDPQSSFAAELWSYFIDVMIALSVFTLIVQPIVDPQDGDGSSHVIWLVFDWVFTGVFIFEFTVRWAVCNATGKLTYLQFWTVPGNICDFVAIGPVPLEALLDVDAQEMRLLRMVRLARLAALARVARIARRTRVAPPTAMVLIVIWGIYLNSSV